MEMDTFLHEKLRLIPQGNYGRDYASVKASNEKHEAFQNAFEDRFQAIVFIAQKMRNENYHDIERINSRFV